MTAVTSKTNSLAPGHESGTPHIELRELTKDFGGVRAVFDVSLKIERGSVHSLIGENGAGKSTLSKIIAGAITPSDGELLVDGGPVNLRSPRQALGLGIAMIDQELAMAPARSALDNVFLGAERRSHGLLDLRTQLAEFEELLRQTGFNIDPDSRVGSLRVADQQKVEILRALARDAKLIIMDEPTAALTQVEADQLYEVISALTRDGVTIVYISHYLEEVLQVSDTITVMRDGVVTTTGPASGFTEASLITAMLGRSLDVTFPDRLPVSGEPDPVLDIRGLSAAGRFADIGLSLRPGEIVGITGLVGSGRSEVLRAIAGVDPVDSGEVFVQGASRVKRSPRAMIDAGVVLLPESRKDDGLMMTRSVAENTVVTKLGAVSSRGLMRRDRQSRVVHRMIEDLGIRTSCPTASVTTLSGGNQQKVLFAKCLMCEPKVLLVDEPTRGVDVGSKKAIYELIVHLASEGMAVLVVSSELEEVLGLSHRLVVMRRGRFVAEFLSEDAREDAILAAAFGTNGASSDTFSDLEETTP